MRHCEGLWADAGCAARAQVSHVEPWMSGNARGPSTAFCILHALFEMKLDTRQMRTLLHHQDSPYIRAVRLRCAVARLSLPASANPRGVSLSWPLTRPLWLAQVGFLYLRYVADPRTLWSWFEEFLRDTEARSHAPEALSSSRS